MSGSLNHLFPGFSGAIRAVQAKDGVLIVEDQFLVALDLESIIATAGYPVVGIAADLAEVDAMPVAPKIALVDVNLRDGATGLEIARHLCNRFGTRIIFVTANPAQIKQPPPTAIGYIQKPFSQDTIERTLCFVMGEAGAVPPRDLQIFA